MHCLKLSIAAALLAASSLDGAFDGPYAPDLWTFIPGPGGSLKTHTADELTLVSGDIGMAGFTDITVSAAGTGTWRFDWSYTSFDVNRGFEAAYYVINDTPVLLTFSSISAGHVETPVNGGDIIGFRVHTLDGLFGPGHLTIANFSAPLPGPGAVAVFLPLLLAARRRHRRDPTATRRPTCTASP